jgi:biotin carboxyl carrier protein
VRYEIEIGGRTRAVVVTRVGAGFAVSVDRRTFQVDAARIDAHTLSLIVDGGSHKGGSLRFVRDAYVAGDLSTGQLTVHIGGTAVPVTVNGRRRWGRHAEAGSDGAGPQRITAPMPGKIVRLLVQAGDLVTARQPLVVVEAMKMENELRAARAGTVAEVHTREGASVEGGALLIVIQ